MTVRHETGAELELRAEIEDLRRKLEQLQAAQKPSNPHGHAPVAAVNKKPSTTVLLSLLLIVLVLGVAAFFGGYLPQLRNQKMLADLAKDQESDLPLVNVTIAERSPQKTQLILPGSIQAVTEAPVLARASGYIKQRFADIGDRVKQGDPLADIDSPELGQQVASARATMEQVTFGAAQAEASLEQGRANEQLLKVTAERYKSLVERGAVSEQDSDNFRAQYEASHAGVAALEKAVQAASGAVGAATANLNRLLEVQSYTHVKAPFAGVITVRNVDTGALVTEGNTLMFRIAQTDRLRTYVNLPQADSTSVHQGMSATVRIPDLPAKVFKGIVTRTSNALDPNTRTMLAEVQVENPQALLLPGMYAQVNFETLRAQPPMLIKGDALVIRPEGPRVAVILANQTVHFQEVELGRDFGDTVEVLSGLEPGQQIIVNPGDSAAEGAKVKAVMIEETGGRGGRGRGK